MNAIYTEQLGKLTTQINERLNSQNGLKISQQNILKCLNEETNKTYGDYYNFIDSLLNHNDFSLNTTTEIFDYLKENDPTLEKSFFLVAKSSYSDWGIAELNVFILSGLLVDDIAKHSLRSLLMCFENEFYLIRDLKNSEDLIGNIYEGLLPSWEYEAGLDDYDHVLFFKENDIKECFYIADSFNNFIQSLAKRNRFIGATTENVAYTLLKIMEDYKSDFYEIKNSLSLI